MQQAYCNAVANGTSVTNYPSVFLHGNGAAAVTAFGKENRKPVNMYFYFIFTNNINNINSNN